MTPRIETAHALHRRPDPLHSLRPFLRIGCRRVPILQRDRGPDAFEIAYMCGHHFKRLLRQHQHQKRVPSLGMATLVVGALALVGVHLLKMF